LGYFAVLPGDTNAVVGFVLSNDHVFPLKHLLQSPTDRYVCLQSAFGLPAESHGSHIGRFMLGGGINALEWCNLPNCLYMNGMLLHILVV